MMRIVAVAVALGCGLALAQAQETVRVRGVIDKVDGPVVTVKASDGKEATLRLADNVTVFGLSKGTMADIKTGDFIGVGAMPQEDGTQRAIQVTIFPEALRGTGEGFRPWDRAPSSTMTNATVETTVSGVTGRELLVKYRGGEQKIVVPPDAAIIRFAPATRDDLKAGAAISVNNALRQPDGSLSAARVSVGRDGFVP